MKKLIILAAVAITAACTQAASFKWAAANVKDYTGLSDYSGEATLYAVISGVDTVVDTTTMSGGKIIANQNQFSSDLFVTGTQYEFYYTLEDASGNTFRSVSRTSTAQATSVPQLAFGNAGSWTAAPTPPAPGPTPIPEPTSGLLMLLGVAGLALRRRA